MKLNAKEIKILSAIKNSFYDDFKIEFLFHSNHLEGSTFTKENLEKLLDEKKVVGEHFLDDVIETRNSLYVFDKVIKDCDEKLDKFMLFDWQRELKRGSVDEEIHNTGCWKKYENRLRNIDLKLAYPDEVDNLMFNLLADWNENRNPTIEDIASFHSRFEKIHPFQDGNGRVGRIIAFKECLKNNIIPFIILDRDKLYYYRGLKEYQNKTEKGYLIDTCLNAQDEYTKMIEYYLK